MNSRLSKSNIAAVICGLALSVLAPIAIAQTSSQSAPSQAKPSVPAAPPSAPAGPTDPFPRANPQDFTAASPTVQTVDSFLHAVWGYDPNRIWRVMGILTTPAPNVTKVVAFVAEKGTNQKVQVATFFVTPDGNHAIGEGAGVVPFGEHPFAATREMMRTRADGAWRGNPSKDLELVEFADLQCPHCKDAQSTMDQIAKDFPKAHIVFQPLPLVAIHPSAFKAAAYAVCVQQKGNDAFFKFVNGVFDTQQGLTPTTDDTILKAAAMRAGLDGAAIQACANTPATKNIVNADMKLAQDAGVEQTPVLCVNGRMIPLTGGLSYDTMKQIIQFQATLDGVDSGATAQTLAPKPPQPKLQDLPKP